jgi:hypothetical protein
VKKIYKNEKGFSAFEAILAIVIVILLCSVGWLVYKSHYKSKQTGEGTNTTVITKDGHVTFLLPASWEVDGRDGSNNCQYSASQAAQLGACLLDISFQPKSLPYVQDYYVWSAQIFKTDEAAQDWYKIALEADCDDPQQSTLNSYQQLTCRDQSGGTEYVITHGGNLAMFASGATDTGPQVAPSLSQYEPQFLTIRDSIKIE